MVSPNKTIVVEPKVIVNKKSRGQDFAITTRTDPELVIDFAKEEIQEWAEVIAANPQEEVSEFAVEQIKQYQKLIKIMEKLQEGNDED